jgi:cation diffusion facilitator family transporter
MGTTAGSPITDKHSAALTSVLAAVGLTAFKIAVGVWTGSLGILAEAAHSGLDLAAALMTLFAVRFSSKPADPEHLYGHGKIENLSALFETFLLLVTCTWIIREAAHRLTSGRLDVEVNIWSFVVIITSIVVDVNRSRMLYKAAEEHNSQALEADALHFATDIWSSLVVLVGLICVSFADRVSSLKYADSVAAIMVALVCLWVTFKLGMRAVQALLDAAPKGLDAQVARAAESVPGVHNCHAVRIRTSGPHTFIDVHVEVDGRQSLTEAHALTEAVEQSIQKIVPGSDVTVHPEPLAERASPPAE